MRAQQMRARSYKEFFSRPLYRAAKATIALCSLLLAASCLLLSLWLVSFTDLLPLDKCRFGPVDEEHFALLQGEAKAQNWTVWPSLSNGLIKPSDPDNLPLETNMARKLHRAIRELAAPGVSADLQLASAHAVLRSMNAKFISQKEVRISPSGAAIAFSTVSFDYVIPTRRLAPFCILCILLTNTTIKVSFDHYPITNLYSEIAINVLLPGFKSTPIELRSQTAYTCPSLPIANAGN